MLLILNLVFEAVCCRLLVGSNLKHLKIYGADMWKHLVPGSSPVDVAC